MPQFTGRHAVLTPCPPPGPGNPSSAARAVALKLTPRDRAIMLARSSVLRAAHKSNPPSLA